MIQRYTSSSGELYETDDGDWVRLGHHLSELSKVRIETIKECLACLPCGSICDPQHISDAVRALAKELWSADL